MAFFAAGWLPLMIIPCPLIKSIYLLSIRDRANRSHSKKKMKGKKKKKKSSVRVLEGIVNRNGLMKARLHLPVLFISLHFSCKYFFVVWLKAGLLSKRVPNGRRCSQRNCLSCPSAERAAATVFLPPDLAPAVFVRCFTRFV